MYRYLRQCIRTCTVPFITEIFCACNSGSWEARSLSGWNTSPTLFTFAPSSPFALLEYFKYLILDVKEFEKLILSFFLLFHYLILYLRNNSPILEGHFFNSQFIESCVFSEPHPSMLGHFLVLFLFPAPQVLWLWISKLGAANESLQSDSDMRGKLKTMH